MHYCRDEKFFDGENNIDDDNRNNKQKRRLLGFRTRILDEKIYTRSESRSS